MIFSTFVSCVVIIPGSQKKIKLSRWNCCYTHTTIIWKGICNTNELILICIHCDYRSSCPFVQVPQNPSVESPSCSGYQQKATSGYVCFIYMLHIFCNELHVTYAQCYAVLCLKCQCRHSCSCIFVQFSNTLNKYMVTIT